MSMKPNSLKKILSLIKLVTHELISNHNYPYKLSTYTQKAEGVWLECSSGYAQWVLTGK